MKGHTSGLAQSQFRPYYKLHSRFLHFHEHTKFVGSIGLVLYAIIISVNCICEMDVEDIRFHKK